MALAGASGCAAVSQAPQTGARAGGFDVLVAHDGDGRKLVVVPATGIMVRDGDRDSQDVQVEWTLAHDVSRGRMLVYSADRTRLLANINAGDVEIQHRGGNVPGFTASQSTSHDEQLAALIQSQ